ncbi:MAG: hypothetical protein ACP5MW_05710, partial [Thermoplasmata archaeon]
DHKISYYVIDFSLYIGNDFGILHRFLAEKHPNNKHIKDKIRQQLQILRERGYLEFKGNGKYEKIK